ncbi:MAG: ABC transporter ATP-binding protein [Limnobacter sp.]|mgnify:CR=1 FL=1|nr:ABC transporter ATP-binding protein [Limnobacter sp. UBA7229]MAG81347.1 ABC transporter ATP-binding protein [Sutterellaceae bacterium]MBT83898.1 ABC transporter ATP-binding protein [Sutterellaceae bacterium]|tara:strand:- start:70468 stop:71226 length:759 start_codon:yes stop_codon:yes gene_type:complete
MSDVVLNANGVSKRFGGLLANNNLNIQLKTGKLHALLGPNGAGKSTCINLLSGDLPVSEGRIELHGKDITAMSNTQRSKLGIGRSYQRTNIMLNFTVLENVRLAAQSRKPEAWKIMSSVASNSKVISKAKVCVEKAGLQSKIDWLASALSHGEQRQLEIAMVLATDAKVLLLDEPLAGMGAQESACMVDLLNQLKQDHAILLVEHDMDAVFAVADEITVMVNGEVLESGCPNTIKQSKKVKVAYLGEEEGNE